MKRRVGACDSLSAQEKALFQRFVEEGYKVDIYIDDLYEAAHGKARGRRSPRKAHQKVGAIVYRINKKLEGRKVVPGDLKRTYRLSLVRAN